MVGDGGGGRAEHGGCSGDADADADECDDGGYNDTSNSICHLLFMCSLSRAAPLSRHCSPRLVVRTAGSSKALTPQVNSRASHPPLNLN